MSGDIHWLVPQLPTLADILDDYQVTYEFYQEVQIREDHQNYCHWYRSVARQHQDELQRMRHDVNLFRLFGRSRLD